MMIKVLGSGCAFTTNIMALGFIGKNISSSRRVFLNGLLYTLGRIISFPLFLPLHRAFWWWLLRGW